MTDSHADEFRAQGYEIYWPGDYAAAYVIETDPDGDFKRLIAVLTHIYPGARIEESAEVGIPQHYIDYAQSTWPHYWFARSKYPKLREKYPQEKEWP